MEAKAEGVAQGSRPAKRRIRNYLLDWRFQLKYTGMVLLVTVAVASFLGYKAYDYSKGQTEMLSYQMQAQAELLPPEIRQDMQGWADDADRKLLTGIILGIVLLSVALGITGIIITHKMVGPAYKMKRLFRNVSAGSLRVEGRLRKGDELQDVFVAFSEMVESLRARQRSEIEELDAAIREAHDRGASDEVVEPLKALSERMRAALD